MLRSVSFRDPDGSVLCAGDRVLRNVAEHRIPDFTTFLNSSTARALTAAGRLIGTRELADGAAELQTVATRHSTAQSFALLTGRLFEHDRVWFPSYPYEWPPEMLFAAGQLTLDLAEAALNEGYGLKDASPFNVLFNGPNPVFVDLLSFECRLPGNSQWLPYAQLLRMFFLPLLAYKHFGSKPHELLSLRPHGIEPEELYAQCSWFRRLWQPFLGSVSIPTWLGRTTNSHRQSTAPSTIVKSDDGGLSNRPGSKDECSDKAQFILRTQFRRLRKLLNRVDPESKTTKSAWSGYASNMSYSPEEFENKRNTVHRWLSASGAKTVLDVGCNTGSFSEVAANLGAAVVSVDSDPVVVGRLWKLAKRNRLNLLPLVVDLAHPTPATGWRNEENPSFLDRAAGRFETVMMLAVLHHLLVTERVPLSGIFDLAANLTRSDLIIEYVDRDDPMFQLLLRGREELHAGFTRELFEDACQHQFTIVEKQPMKANLRTLYLLRKK